MNHDTIERLAREAGGSLESWMTNPPQPAMWLIQPQALVKLASLIRAEVLEEAVRAVVEKLPQPYEYEPADFVEVIRALKG